MSGTSATIDGRQRSSRTGGARAAACLVALSVAVIAPAAIAGSAISLGQGTYYTQPKGGLFSAGESPPSASYRSGMAATRAAPTNQWYSSVMFQRWSQPLYTQPMAYRAVESGFEISRPGKRLNVTERGLRVTLESLHAPEVTVEPVSFKPQDARLSGFSDWLAEVSMASTEGDVLKATVLHGSPFSYYECSTGDVRFSLVAAPQVLSSPTDPARDPRVASFKVDGHAYAIFAPTGATWDWSNPTELVLHLPASRRYFSVAGLPDDREATLSDFLGLAYAFPTDTRVEWTYDQRASALRSTFSVATVAREGKNLTTFMGLYPHQWTSTTASPASTYEYDSVRGPIRLIAGNSFTVERAWRGIMPTWAGLQEPGNSKGVDSLLVGDLAKSDQLFKTQGRGTYWYGKGLGAVAQLMSVAEAQGQTKTRNKLLEQLKERLEYWFDGKHNSYFVQDSTLGTFVGLPQDYGSVSAMNDHHFHYGYWLMAAAHVALRDPAWAAEDQWGGMVGKIAADIATSERGRSDFPYLRNFDAYEGHSWASGDANFDAGNNQESSSEAVNAWAGLVLWGEATGNDKLRDLGIYLYTSETAAVQHYWFDTKREVLAPEFDKPFASMVFGGKYAYDTWWTVEPRQITGINMIPITPASTYLGQDPAYVHRVMDALPAAVATYQNKGASDGTPADIWQDILVSYLALADADAGLAMWSKGGSVESGETRTHTLYWLQNLREMGRPDFSVSADTPLYAVFKDGAGERTYLAYNAHDAAIKVTFSDGKTVEVAPRSLARSH
jgi:endoglucanase Acf2